MLAPMAGYTDSAFRSVCLSYGADFTVTEMVSSAALVMGNINTQSLLHSACGDEPFAVQIFGHDPRLMAQSVALPCLTKYRVIDVNMGCPVKKIVGNGDGSALLENPKLAADIVRALKLATNRPVSVKFRLGVEDGKNCAEFAATMADAGVDLMTVHLRTRRQMYSGSADYSYLPQIVAAAHGVPVVANGDVTSRDDYLRAMDLGAYGVAVGRGALGKPYVFAQIKGKPYEFDLLETVRKQLRLSEYKSPRVIANEMKKHIAFYLKGYRGAKSTVAEINAARSAEQQMEILERFFKGESQK